MGHRDVLVQERVRLKTALTARALRLVRRPLVGPRLMRPRLMGPRLMGLSLAGVLALSAGGIRAQETAQDAGPGRLRLTFGIEQGLDLTDNLGLDVPSAGSAADLTTGLSFGLLTETRTSRLAIDGSIGLRVASGGNLSGTETRLSDPSLTLSYGRNTASASLQFDAYLRETDIDFLRALTDFPTGPDGGVILPEDLADLTGTGTRRSQGVDLGLTWGEGARTGFGLSAGISGLRYSDTSSATLFDSDRRNLGATLRFSLSDSTDLTFGLRYGTFTSADPTSTRRNTVSLDAGFSQSLATGSLTAELTASNTEDGTQTGFSIGRSYALPRGTLSASIGATRGVTGSASLTGALNLQQTLPRGQFSAGLRRSVSAGSDDTEELVTALSIDLMQTLTPLSSVQLGLDYVRNEETATGNRTDTASLAASYNRALTPDWGLNLGYRYGMRDQTGSGRARENSVFLTLSRDFVFLP